MDLWATKDVLGYQKLGYQRCFERSTVEGMEETGREFEHVSLFKTNSSSLKIDRKFLPLN